MNKYKYPNQIYSIDNYGDIEMWEIKSMNDDPNHGYVYYKTHLSNFLLVFLDDLSQEEFIKQISIDNCYLTIEEALNHEDIL